MGNNALTSRLSKRELDVFCRLAEGLKNREIAAALCIHETTVKSHVHSIFRKLGVKDRLQALRYALGQGVRRK